jgi:ketosteroid isomerase-like protein
MKMQKKYAADEKTVQEIHALIREYEEIFNKNDAAALAALVTEDTVQMSPEGPICGSGGHPEKLCRFV